MALLARILLFWSIAFLLIPAQAKDRTFSLVGVYNQSNVVWEVDTQSSNYVGDSTLSDSTLNFGVLLETPIQGKWGFETGLIFLQRGFQMPSFYDDSIKDVFRWKNFFVPLVGRFHPTSMFTGSIGLYAAQSVGDLSHFQSSDTNNISYQSMKAHGFRSFDWGMTYSAGLTIDINSSTEVMLEIRFNESWSNLLDTSLPNIDNREKAQIRETQLYLGILI